MSTVLVLFQLQGGRKKKGRHYILNCQRFEYGLHINGLGFRYTDLFFFPVHISLNYFCRKIVQSIKCTVLFSSTYSELNPTPTR